MANEEKSLDQAWAEKYVEDQPDFGNYSDEMTERFILHLRTAYLSGQRAQIEIDHLNTVEIIKSLGGKK